MRVYYDRLINSQDKDVVGGMIKTQVEENFKSTLDYVIKDPILFGDYMTALDEGEPRLYQDIQVSTYQPNFLCHITLISDILSENVSQKILQRALNFL